LGFKVVQGHRCWLVPPKKITKITSLETRDSRLSHIEDFMILSCVVLTQYSSVTDRQTDRRTEGRLCRSKDALSITCCRA